MVEKINYNPWPLGKLPKEFQRPEPEAIKQMGYHWDDPRDIIDIFEKKVAAFAGSKYAVAVDCCTHAIELCLIYEKCAIQKNDNLRISIPKNTYISIAHLFIKHKCNIEFYDEKWEGIYNIIGTQIIDGAVRWTKGMYFGFNSFHCLSFQIKKRIPIGRGGMILTDDIKAYEWLKLARYDGRDMSLPYDHPQHIKMTGYHYYMTPEDAARGIILMDNTPEVNDDSANWTNYPDVSKMLKI
jgi:dTDP-4-amino-4,6-dideoxygalactose transaminase